MKLRKQQIDKISYKIIDELISKKFIKVENSDIAKALIRKIVTDDLLVEDKLNDEVRTILDAHSLEIKGGSIEYHRMFKMVKDKLIRDRELIL